MRCSPLAALLVALAAAPATGALAAEPWRDARPGHAWSFPRDHWSHPGYRTEWWYLTGQLEADGGPPGPAFGYQLTFFRIGLLPARPDLASPWASANLVMAHAALTDLRQGRHLFSEVLWREAPFLAGFDAFPARPLAWALAPPGTGGRWTLDFDGEAFSLAVEDAGRGLALRLRARPERPVVLQGPGGFSAKSADGAHASLYYSLTRLATEGTVSAGGRAVAVRGTSWLDREFGSSQLAPRQVGWDWWSLRLADGRDLMLYVLRRADGSTDFAKGTLVGLDGTPRWLAAADFRARATATWRSPATGATYPARWEIEVPSAGLRLEVVPALADQENRAALAGGVFYWEGAVRVLDAAGRPAGEGYVELTGYGPGSRPPI